MGVLSVIKDYGTELLNAVRNNDLITFKNICEKHLKHDKEIAQLCTLDIKHRPSRKFACPLILAARLEDSSILRYMMEIGTDPNFIHHSIYTSGQRDVVTPLHVAVDLNLVHSVNILLNFNADPNTPDHNEDTPFIISIKKSNWILMKMMLSRGGNPSIADKKENAPLHIASLHGHLQIVKTLLKNNADIHQRGYQGAIPSHIAAREGHIHLIQIFCSADPTLVNTKIPCFTDNREKAMMHLAAERGHAETVIGLIDQFGADLNLKDSGGNTPLHCVVLHFYRPEKMRDKDYFYGTAKILVKYKSLINEKNQNGQTALHLAAMNNYPKIVELLLSVGAHAFAEDNNRLKPIDVVPESDVVSKQLLKTAMLNPKPPLNASSLSLMQNSSYQIGTIGDVNGLKHSFITKSMLESNGSTPLIKSKNTHPDSFTYTRSITAGHSPKNHRSKKPAKCQTNFKLAKYSNQNKKILNGKRSRKSQSSETNLPSVFSNSSQDSNWPGYWHCNDASSEESDDETLTERKSLNRQRDDAYYVRNRYSRRNHQELVRISKIDRSYAIERNNNKIAARDVSKANHKKSKSEQNMQVAQEISNEGIQVHRFPGKPKTIEVEYMSGPITIEFESQDQSLQRHSGSQIRDQRGHKISTKSEKMRQKTNDVVNDWFNEMTKYNKNQKKKKSTDDYNDDAWDEYEVDEKHLNSLVQSNVHEVHKFGSSEKQVRKQERTRMKQKQYEEQIEMEKLPLVDPEPPSERLELIDDDISYNSSFDSESFEEKISVTHKVLNDSASKKICEILQNIQSKWSQGEDDDEILNIQKKQEEHNEPPYVKHEEKIFTGASPNIFQSNLKETMNNEVIKMETISIMPTTKKTLGSEDDKNNADMSSIKKDLRSLNFKISGETPKAYTRKGKASARAKFILATPAKIESSSEASDSEQNVSSTSLQRRVEWSKPLTPFQSNKKITKVKSSMPMPLFQDSDFETDLACLKPYKSFGKIEIKTNALEEMDKQILETSFSTETSSEAISSAPLMMSTIIPEKYQIKKTKVTNLDDYGDIKEHQKNLQHLDKIAKDKETENVKRFPKVLTHKQLQFKNSRSRKDLLKMYEEEPNTRKHKVMQQKKNKFIEKSHKKISAMKEPFPLPEGISTEVWLEACNTSPLASSDTYASANKTKKTRSTKMNIKSMEQVEELSSFSQLDISVPLVSDDLSQPSSTNDSLDVDVPIHANLKNNTNGKNVKGPKQVKQIVKKMTESKDAQTHTRKTFQLKAHSFRDSSNRNIGDENKNQSILYKGVERPPKPLNLYASHFTDDELERDKENTFEDLNNLPFYMKKKKAMPRFPSRPYDVYRISSDSEMNICSSRRQHFYYIHSEAEASDFEPPKDPPPGTSFKEAALHLLNLRNLELRHKTLLLRQPGHRDKSFDYLRKLYQPRKKRPRVSSMHLLPSAGKYGNREMRRVMSNHYYTESESEIDQNRSFITEDEFEDKYDSSQSLTLKKDKISPVYESLMRYKKFKQARLQLKKNENELTRPLEPDGISLERYDDIAKIWMEQVDKKTVLKSSNMYLKVLPRNQDLPKSLVNKDSFLPLNKPSNIVPQWVMARTRFVQCKTSKEPFQSEMSFNEESLTHRHLILFFKIGIDWMELAWVLFDGLSKESEVVRMIRDIQIKHPSSLSKQVEDLMKRWWNKRGEHATIQELQRALDFIQMFYVQEEIAGKNEEAITFLKYMETEDDLETGEIDGDDPNVSKLCHEYNSKSLNNSIICQSLKNTTHSEEPTSDQVMRELQTTRKIKSGMNEELARASRPSSRSQDLDVSCSTNRYEGESFSVSSVNDKFGSSLYHTFSKKKNKQSMQETNL